MTTTSARCRRRRRSGFALPAAIMALVVLSALVAGALYVSTEELKAGRVDVADQRALTGAELALERAIAGWDTRRNTRLAVGASDTVEQRVAPNGDGVHVIVTRVQRLAFWVTSRGTSAADGRVDIPARHTIAASLQLVAPRIPLLAALRAGGKVTVDNATVDGRAEAGSPAMGLACAGDTTSDVAGVLVADSMLVCGAECNGVTPAGVFGTPAVSAGAADLTSDSVGASIADDTRSDLARRAAIVLPGGTLAPRPSVEGGACETTDPMNWGDPASGGACADYLPVIHIRGDAALGPGAVGQGILLVDGTLRVDAGARFSGVVIVTNDVEVTGAGAGIDGVVFAGDADRADGSRVANGAVVRFASCVVQRAALAAARLRRTPGRWWTELR